LQIRREVDRIGAAFEAGQIVQRELDGFVGDVDRAAVLPVPVGALGAEGRLKRLAVDDQLKLSGGVSGGGGVPPRDPVLGADEEAIGSRGGELDGRRRIVDGTTQTMSQHVRRAHDVDELRVELPSAVLIEAFGFDEHAVGFDGIDRRDAAQQQAACNGPESKLTHRQYPHSVIAISCTASA
jgi:hypothetical protein